MATDIDAPGMTMADAHGRDLSKHRANVGLCLVNASGLVWLGERAHSDRETHPWQMPQGGVDPGEDLYAAALREMAEETGVRADLVSLLGVIDRWLTYDFPPDVLARKRTDGKDGWIGQKQRWFAFRFLGSDRDVALDSHQPAEFRSWRWERLARTPELIIPWKRPVYDVVAAEFARFASD